MRIYQHYLLISLAVVVLDQGTKLWVHFNLPPGPESQIILLGGFLKFHHTTNPGMAFGMNSSLSSYQLFAIRSVFALVLGLFTIAVARNRLPRQVVISMALILGGALGNMIDNALYGELLGNQAEGSPGGLFAGQVIDWIYLDIWKGIVPQWTPLLGGKYLILLPIFNLADLAIFAGVIWVLFTTRPYRPITSW